MSDNKDIRVPEGYFEDLRARLRRIPEENPVEKVAEEAPRRIRILPYLAYAASLLALVAVGNFVLRKTAPAAEGDVTAENEEIIEYLIEGGTTVEHLDYYLAYEEDYR